jgi:hypothetical protein
MDENISHVIFSPIRFVVSQLGHGMSRGSGWWETRYNSHMLVTRVPQASAVIDPIAALEPGTHVTFIGFAGALADIQVGRIVEAETARIFGKARSYRRSWMGTFSFPAVTVATVGSLSESTARFEALRLKHDCVDMETALLYAACRAGHKPARSILIVTDDFAENPFFLGGVSENGLSNAVDLIAKSISTRLK